MQVLIFLKGVTGLICHTCSLNQLTPDTWANISAIIGPMVESANNPNCTSSDNSSYSTTYCMAPPGLITVCLYSASSTAYFECKYLKDIL